MCASDICELVFHDFPDVISDSIFEIEESDFHTLAGNINLPLKCFFIQFQGFSKMVQILTLSV